MTNAGTVSQFGIRRDRQSVHPAVSASAEAKAQIAQPSLSICPGAPLVSCYQGPFAGNR